MTSLPQHGCSGRGLLGSSTKPSDSGLWACVCAYVHFVCRPWCHPLCHPWLAVMALPHTRLACDVECDVLWHDVLRVMAPQIPFIAALVPRQRKAQEAVALIRETTNNLIRKCKVRWRRHWAAGPWREQPLLVANGEVRDPLPCKQDGWAGVLWSTALHASFGLCVRTRACVRERACACV